MASLHQRRQLQGSSYGALSGSWGELHGCMGGIGLDDE